MVGFTLQKVLFLAVAVCIGLAPLGIRGQLPAVVEFEEPVLTIAEVNRTIDVCVVVIDEEITTNSRITLNSGSPMDSATGGPDYIEFDDERLTFTPGQTRVCAVFTVREDGNVEGTESARVTLTSRDLSLGSQTTVIINILDSDRIVVGFSPLTYTVVEGGDRVSVCVARIQGSLSRALTLNFQVLMTGNATSELEGQDFFAAEVSVNLAAQAPQACEEFGAVDDNTDPVLEGIEFYQIEVTTLDNADIEPGREIATIFIEDNDGATVSVETSELMMIEGNDGDMNEVEVCVVLNDLQSGLMRELVYTLSVDLETADDADVMPVDPQTVTFPSTAMVNDRMCVQYQIIGDAYKEVDETFRISVSGENQFDVLPAVSQFQVTILDDQDLVQFCLPLDPPENGLVSVPSMLEFSTATYTCNVGFILEGNATRSCERDPNEIPGEWSGSAPICRDVDCGDPPPASANGDRTFTETGYLSEAIYSCTDDCYQLVPDSNTLVCGADEQWMPTTPPTCEIRLCGAPPDISNCTLSTPASSECGAVTTYAPRDPIDFMNFTIIGDTTLTCGPDGMWQEDNGEVFPFCIPTGICPQPPLPIDDGCGQPIEAPVFTSLEENAMSVYSCPTGCFLNPANATNRTCIAINITTGFWSDETPVCNGVTCPQLTDPDNGTVSVPSVMFNMSATYSCIEGYMIEGDRVRVCGPDGMWSGTEPLCVPVECEPLDLDNGNVMITGNNFRDNATYACDEGYTLVGNPLRSCNSSGNWTGDIPTCFLDCENDTEVEGFQGMRNDTGMTHGTVIMFTCSSDGCPGTRQCFNGTWSGLIPKCEGERCSRLNSTDEFTVTHSIPVMAGTTAMYECSNGFEIGNFNTRECRCNGTWTEQPTCAEERGGDGDGDGLPLGAIIGIAVGAAVFLIILIILLICCIACCVRSRKNNKDKQLENYYRDFMRPYTTPYNSSNTEGTPMVAAPQPRRNPPVEEMEKEVLQAESYLHSDEEDDDDLPSPTPSNEDMDEYRLRLHAVESGSQRRVRSQIVAEKVEIEI